MESERAGFPTLVQNAGNIKAPQIYCHQDFFFTWSLFIMFNFEKSLYFYCILETNFFISCSILLSWKVRGWVGIDIIKITWEKFEHGRILLAF